MISYDDDDDDDDDDDNGDDDDGEYDDEDEDEDDVDDDDEDDGTKRRRMKMLMIMIIMVRIRGSCKNTQDTNETKCKTATNKKAGPKQCCPFKHIKKSVARIPLYSRLCYLFNDYIFLYSRRRNRQ